MVPGGFRGFPGRFRVVPGRFRVVPAGSGWVPRFTPKKNMTRANFMREKMTC